LPFKLHSRAVELANSDHEGDEELSYNSIAVSGFISKENNFAEPFVLSKLFKTGKWSDMTTTTDDIKFARKRLMSPGIVNSGLTNVLKFAEVDKSDSSLETALTGKDVWLCFNLTSTELPAYAAVAAKAGLKRAIFAVNVSPEDSGAGVTFDTAVATLAAANIAYTILKFGPVRKMGEAKYPYRIARGESALPAEGRDMLSSDDLMRVSQEFVFSATAFVIIASVTSLAELSYRTFPNFVRCWLK
jgi:hypothetical protein